MQWVSVLVHTHGLKPRTVRGAVATVASIFARALEDGLIARNPCKGLSLPELDGAEVIAVRARVPVWGPPKTAAGYRTIPVAQCVIDVMAQQLAERKAGPEGLIFTGRTRGPLSGSTTNQALSRALDPLGWPDNTGLHLFRHYYASLLKVSRVASSASFRKIHERPLPATSPYELDQGRLVEASSHAS
ncbi:MAG: hypothetical protein WBL53_23600 [Pseudonocardiaceae bacterium]